MTNQEFYKRTDVLANLDGDEACLDSLAAMFVADSARYCSTLTQAVGDRTILVREAHTLKSLFATFYCEVGRQAAQKLEAMAKTSVAASRGELDESDELLASIAEVIAAIKRLATILENELTGQ